MPARRPRTAIRSATRFGIDAARRPPRRAERARGDERLDLDEDRPAAFERRRDDAAGCRLIVLGEERPRRVGHLRHAGLAHLEHPDLLGRSEAVLRGPDEPQRREALALEGEDRVDEMLERLRPGQRAVLRDVPDEYDGNPLALRELHQAEGRLADLTDAARRPIELGDGRRLDRVDDDHLRPLGPGDLGDVADLGLGDDPDSVAGGAVEEARVARRAGGPGQPTPRRSHRERTAPDAARPAAAWRRSVDLPIPGSPPTSTTEPSTRPPPRTRSSSPIPIGRRGRAGSATAPRAVGWASAPAAGEDARRPPGLADHRFDEAVPGRAARGTVLPSGGRLLRTPGRRTDSGACLRPGSRQRLRGGGDQPASTGVRLSGLSAAWMSRPASGSLSTTIVVPGSYLPSRRCSARTSSIMFWMTRRSGRAP